MYSFLTLQTAARLNLGWYINIRGNRLKFQKLFCFSVLDDSFHLSTRGVQYVMKTHS